MSKNLTKQVGLENSIEAGVEVGLKPELLIQSLKSMYVARQIDEKAMTLLKQGKVFFPHRCFGS
jgi:TPP-dependent pyruvate/acetoin dehydrogenase alpha subunit